MSDPLSLDFSFLEFAGGDLGGLGEAWVWKAWQFSAPAFGCGSPYSAQAKCGSAVLALCLSCVGLGHSLLQLVAAEAFFPDRTNVAVQS